MLFIYNEYIQFVWLHQMILLYYHHCSTIQFKDEFPVYILLFTADMDRNSCFRPILRGADEFGYKMVYLIDSELSSQLTKTWQFGMV